jgi:hypothetical protein
VGDFGKLSFVYNRYQRDRDGWVITPEMLAIGFLRPFKLEELAHTGDARNWGVVVEACLIVRNEAAHGLCADLDTTVQ